MKGKNTFGAAWLLLTGWISVPEANAAATDTVKAEWAAYNHAALRFEYPKGWKVSHHVYPPKDGRFWRVKPPSRERGTPPGTIDIDEDLTGKEKRTLEEHFSAMKRSQFLIKPPEEAKQIKPRGGECLVYEVEESSALIGSRPLAGYANCYGKNGHFFSLSCDLLNHGEDRGEAEPRRKIFRHLLETLEFK